MLDAKDNACCGKCHEVNEMANKYRGLIFTLGLSASCTQALPLVDIYAGVYSWRADYSGDIELKSGNSDLNLDWKDDLGVSASTATMFLIGVEHAVPILPDLQIRHTNISTDGSELINQSFEFDDKVFSGSEIIDTKLDLTHTDYSLYWGLPIPMTRINFGATFRHFSGSVKMEGQTSGTKASEDLNLVVPLGYARAELDVPSTSLQLGAELQGIAYGGSSLVDFNLYGNYEFTVALLDIGLTAGYRSFNLNIDSEDFGGDDSDLAVETRIQGLYAGVTLHL
jgi:outer membrane protein